MDWTDKERMKILYIINDNQTNLSRQIIDVQSKDNEIKVIELSKKEVSHETIIDDIFSYDRVISW
jgi:hypothetical protein